MVNAALFRGLFHINVTRKLVAVYSMWWQQFYLRYFLLPILPKMFVMLAPNSGVSWKVTLSGRICIRSVLGLSEEIFLLGLPFPTFPLVCYLGDPELNTHTTVYSSLDQSTSLAKGQCPIYNFGPLSLH